MKRRERDPYRRGWWNGSGVAVGLWAISAGVKDHDWFAIGLGVAALSWSIVDHWFMRRGHE